MPISRTRIVRRGAGDSFFDDNSSVSSSDSKRTVVNNSDYLDLTLLTSDPGESFHAIGIILIRTTTYVILFSPIRGYGRILVPIKLVRRFEKAGGTPKPGTWMSFRRVQKLIPNDDVDFGGCTHIATSKPRPYNLATAIPSLKHTFFRGHVQFLMSFDLNTIGNVQIVSDDAFDEHYVLISTICVPVVVPIKRIEIMFGSNSVLTAPYIISLWVENSTAVCGVSLKLMDSTPIEVKCPEGNIAPDDWMLRSGLNHLVLEERESKLETAPLPPTLRENEAVEVEIPPHQRHHRESFEQDRSPPSAPSAVVTENEAVASSELKAQQQQNPCTQPCSMKAASPPPTLRESRAVIAPEVPAQYDHVEPAGTSSIVKKEEVIASVAVETQNHEESVGQNKLLMTVDLNTAGNAQLVSDEESNEYYVLISTTGEPVLAPIDRIENIFVSKSVLTAPYIISLWVEVAHVVFGVSLKLVDSTRIEVKDLKGNMAPDNWLLLAGVNRLVLEEQGGQLETAPLPPTLRENEAVEVEIPPHQRHHRESFEQDRSPPSAPSAVVTENEAVASSELKAQQQQNPCTQPCSMKAASPPPTLRESRAVVAPDVPAQYDHVEPAGTSSIVKKEEVIASVAVETQNHEESVGQNKLLMTVDLNTAGNAQLVSDEESNEYYVLISTTGEPLLAPIDRIENIFVSKSVLTAPYIISLWVEVAHVVFGVSLKLVDSTRIEVKDLEGNMAPDNWLLLAGVNRPVLEEQGGQVEPAAPSSFSWREVSSMEVETQHHQSVEHNRSPPSAPSAVVTENEAVASSELKAQQQQNPCTQPCSNVPSPDVSLHEYRLPMPEPPNRNAQLKIPRRLIKLNNAEPDW